MHVMQSSYFDLQTGRWPSTNDWTAEVAATQISSTLSALTSTLSSRAQRFRNRLTRLDVIDGFAFENTLNYYFDHLSSFYFGERATSLKTQAYDDMLWGVLNWLENVKLQDVHSSLRHAVLSRSVDFDPVWHGVQFKMQAAKRAREFYEVASQGWDTELCGGGMIWSRHLLPYKNAITNELFVAASIGMYLYHSDDESVPLTTSIMVMPSMVAAVQNISQSQETATILAPETEAKPTRHHTGPRNPTYLQTAQTAYAWLNSSRMILKSGLYADGFHIKNYKDRTNPGTRQCDVLSHAVFTYNQGVILSGLRGLWLATGNTAYLKDGHDLIHSTIKATGWPETSSQTWKGLGRGGVLEDTCDSAGTCSQDSQTFKSIFWHHFTEFCRPLYSTTEEKMMFALFPNVSADAGQAEALEGMRAAFMQHQRTCSGYAPWIKHNALAAMETRDGKGRFGMWWGRKWPDGNRYGGHMSALSPESPFTSEDEIGKDLSEEIEASILTSPGREDQEGDGVNEENTVSGISEEAPLFHSSRHRHRNHRGRKQRIYQSLPSHPHSRPLLIQRALINDTNDTTEPTLVVPIDEEDLDKEAHIWKDKDKDNEKGADTLGYTDVNDRGRGRTVETQAGGLAVLRALYVWESSPTLAQLEAVGRWGAGAEAGDGGGGGKQH